MSHWFRILVLLLLLTGLASTVWAHCLNKDERGQEDTSIWRGGSPIPLAELARCAAPIFSFSPQEEHFPTLLPGALITRLKENRETPDTRRVVYYQLERIAGGSVTNDPAAPVSLILEKNGFVVLRYFLYFTNDAVHTNDLERVDIHLRSVKDLGYGVWSLWPERVVGQAHGNVWYSNALHLSRKGSDIWPATILVEEGKHGLAPDADANGVYVPFIDVNEHVSDAWGVRDSLGSKTGFVAPEYNSGMTTSRSGGLVLRPDQYMLVELGEDINGARCQCRKASGVGRDDSQPNLKCPCNLEPLLQYGWNFCGALEDAYHPRPEVISPSVTAMRIARQLTAAPDVAAAMDAKVADVIAVSVGRDQSSWRVTWVPRAVELTPLSGWIVPKLRWTSPQPESKVFQLTVGYTPSASRWADWYADVGYGFNAETANSEIPSQLLEPSLPTQCVGCGVVFEAGVRWKGPTSIGLLGGRLGVAADYVHEHDELDLSRRDSNVRAFRHIRLVYDFSIGPW